MDPRKKKLKKRASSGVYIKVIVLGDSGVGKTCLINRYTSGFYKDSFTATLGVDFKVQAMEKNEIKINLQIWDTAGQERFKTLTKSYFQGCMGVLLIFSLTDLDSFKNIEKWLQQLDEHTHVKMTKLLIGSKVDSPDQRVVPVDACSQMSQKYDLQYFEVSAKTGYNVQNVFESIADRILSKNRSTFSQFFHSKSVKLERTLSEGRSIKNCEC